MRIHQGKIIFKDEIRDERLEKVLKLKSFISGEVSKDSENWYIINKELNIRVAESSYEEAIFTFKEHLYMLWKNYVEAEGPMSVGAQKLKSKLQEKIESCQ